MQADHEPAVRRRGDFGDVDGDDGEQHPTRDTCNEASDDHHGDVDGPDLEGGTNNGCNIGVGRDSKFFGEPQLGLPGTDIAGTWSK